MQLRRVVACFALSILVTLSLAAPALAAWPYQSTLNLQIPSPGVAQNPAAAEDGSGGAFVVYEDLINVAVEGINLRAHHVLQNGTMDPTWGSGKAICTNSGNQSNPKVAADGAGGFYVVWQDYRSGTSDIYALRMTAAGALASGWSANGNRIGGVTSKDDILTSIGVAPDQSLYAGWHAVITGSDYDAYLTHVHGSGSVVSGWPANGLNLHGSSTAVQGNLVLAPAKSGGVFIALEDAADGTFDIAGGRITAAGVVQWSAFFSNGAGNQYVPKIVEDADGGVFVAWEDVPSAAVGVARFSGSGASLGWNWLPEETYGYSQSPLQLLSDGAAGAYLVYKMSVSFVQTVYYVAVARLADRTGLVWPQPAGLFGQEIPYTAAIAVPDGSGGLICGGSVTTGSEGLIETAAIAPGGGPTLGWDPAYLQVSNGFSNKTGLACVTDGAGGIILFWTDHRGGAAHIYAQRVARFGRMGSPDPDVISAKDVLNDQGGQVRVSWNASYLDMPPAGEVTGYRVWREVPTAAAQVMLARGTAALETGGPGALASPTAEPRRTLRTTQVAGTIHYWEPVGEVPATGLPGYSYVVPTPTDSTGGSNPLTYVAVSSQTDAGLSWMSMAVGGYSVDNLAPAAPAPFNATWVTGAGAFLNWGAGGEGDLAGYRLYRGDTPGFTPGPGNQVYEGTETSYHDTHLDPGIFKLCAYDAHGNVSAFVTVIPAGTVDAPGRGLPAALALARVTPNPARGAATVGYALPRDGRVKLEVFDAQGRRVRTLVDEARTAGEWTASWDGRDGGGRGVRAGLYFVRLEAQGQVLTQRLVRVDQP